MKDTASCKGLFLFQQQQQHSPWHLFNKNTMKKTVLVTWTIKTTTRLLQKQQLLTRPFAADDDAQPMSLPQLFMEAESRQSRSQRKRRERDDNARARQEDSLCGFLLWYSIEFFLYNMAKNVD